MSTTTMLALVRAAAGEMGITQPSSVVGSQDLITIQLLALLNALGLELVREKDWQYLCTEHRFSTQFLSSSGTTTSGSAVVTGISDTSTLAANTWMVSGTGIPGDCYISSVDSATQVTLNQAATASGTVTLTFAQTKYTMPTDYDRQIDRTHYDKSKRWEMLGPETPQQWQWLKSSYISTGPRIRYRIMGGLFQIWPILGTNEYLGFEYVSNYWVFAAGGASPSKSSFTADTDTCIWPDRLMISGLKKKFFEVKGFDATGFDNEFQTILNQIKAQEAGALTLSMAPRISQVLIGWENIPDSGYGS